MVKILPIYIVLGISISAFMVMPANAGYHFNSDINLTIGSYDAEFCFTGGTNLHDGALVAGHYYVEDGVLLGVNPQGHDVTAGVAGLAEAENVTPTDDALIDHNGNQCLTQTIRNEVNDFASLTDFTNYWGITDTWEDLLNNNWTPETILVTWFQIVGEIWTDCTGDTVGTCSTLDDSNTWNCVTDEDIRHWNEDGSVIYVCNEDGYPIAFSDSYSAREGRSLGVRAPGALGNDWDQDGDPLTAVSPPDDAPTHGIVTLNSDGSFTYTPNDGFTGTDSFTYHANDGSSDSNIATVTIVVE